MSASPVSCLIVDDHLLVAQAVGGLLSELCGLELVAVCGSVAEALRAMEQSPPDLLLLDVNLPGERWQDAVAALRRLNPAGRLIFLTGLSEQFVPPPQLDPILLAVVDKGRAWDDLVRVVTAWRRVSPRQPPARADVAILPLDRLSPRERRVFDALGLGLLNKEIARSLGLSVATVETYRKSLSAKLALSGAELVRAAVLYRCSSGAASLPLSREGSAAAPPHPGLQSG